MDGCRFHVESHLESVLDDFGDEGLLLGRVVAAHADRNALRSKAVPDGDLVHDQPLLAYLHASQFARIDRSTGFPFPKDFRRK